MKATIAKHLRVGMFLWAFLFVFGNESNAYTTHRIGYADTISLEQRLARIIQNTKQDTSNSANNSKGVREREMFKDFSALQDPKDPNSKVSLSDYVGKGKYVILDFWASWCAPCIAEFSVLRYAYRNLPKDRVTIVSVAVNDRYLASKKVVKEHNLEWNVILNAGNTPMELYGFNNIPQIILFGPDGRIIKKGLRGEDILTFTAKMLRNNPALKDPDKAVRSLTY